MAISFTGNRNFTTAALGHMFSNIPTASMSFKVRCDSVTGGLSPSTVVSRTFPFNHYFYSRTGTSQDLVLNLQGVNGQTQTTVLLTIGSVYVIVLTWDGVSGKQTCYFSGVPSIFGHVAGNTSNWTGAITIGSAVNDPNVIFTLDDFNAWDSYVATQADAQFLTNNGDPTTIGTSAPWRLRWTMTGTVGANAAVGDAGLKNAYGLGGDFTSVAGPGTAIYQSPLIWAPTVTAHPYVTGCGKLIGCTFTLNTDGSPVIPTQVITTPTLAVNGTNPGALVVPWGGSTTGVHQCELWSTPGTPPLQIASSDVATLTAPPAWASTPAGPVGALSGTIDNRSGASSVQVESLTKVLAMGFNLPEAGGLESLPWANALHKIAIPYQFEVVNQPCEAGDVLVAWDTNPDSPVILTLSSGAPSRVTVTHLPQYDVSPSSGIGYVRVYQVAYVTSSDYKVTVGGSGVELSSNATSVTNLWVGLVGEWDIVGGAAVIPDRTDRMALSRIFLDRVAGSGSFRAVDSTACGGASLTYPYPELLLPSTSDFWWGYNPIQLANVGFTSIGPVDTTATPYIYSAEFRQPANIFNATLTDTISTTPAVGTHETYRFSNVDTTPLMAGLEIQIDSEIMRVISADPVAGTATLYRGSNGTTPAIHSPGVVNVFGRQPITSIVHSDGTAPYTAPVYLQCNAPHGMTTGHGYYPAGAISIVMADGTVEPNFPLATFYATGPSSFMSIWSGYYASKPNGTKPSQTYTLNPVSVYMQRIYLPGMPLEVYCNLVSRISGANLHVNVPKDACRDMIYTIARLVRDHFPAGRKIYPELSNEPWNFSPPFQENLYSTLIRPLMMPAALNTFPPLSAYCYAAVDVHRIFHEVFTAAGRDSEIIGVVNCQMGSGNNQVTPYLNMALSLGQPLGGIACAPYYSLGMSGNGLAATVAAFNAYDDDQAAEMVLHDITYDASSTGLVPLIQSITGAVTAYNQAHGSNVIVIGYEGNLEFASPTGAANRDPRSHDVNYNPNYYHVEQGFYAILQNNGFKNLHKYGLGIGWGPPAWGDYHARTQRHSRGDGLNGAIDNRHFLTNPTSPFDVAPGRGFDAGKALCQDIQVDSVRGQALIDWNASLGPPPTATAYTLTAPSPATGPINTVSGFFAITPNGLYTGTVTITPSGGGLTSPIVLTWSSSSATQTFTITPTVVGTVTLTPSNSGSLTDPAAVQYTATSPPVLATAYTFTAPTPVSGLVNVASGPFTVQPNGPYTGTVTITLMLGGLTGPIVLTWAASSAAQSFSITPTIPGIITLTPSNSGGLTDAAPLSYAATAPPSNAKFILVRQLINHI